MITPIPHGCSEDVVDHARRLLSHGGLSIAEVIRVDVDSVLYVDRAGRPRTAWLRFAAGDLVIEDEPGFSACAPQPLAA